MHAIVTDPPYGLHEYTGEQQRKLRAGKGGVWRIPPSFDGHRRSPLPRFTTLDESQLGEIREFFVAWGKVAHRVLVPGANVVVASNPLVFRKPLEGRVQDNLRKWKTGEFRRPRDEKPFGDVIASAPTRRAEKALAPHPSLKPQAFLRQLVRGGCRWAKEWRSIPSQVPGLRWRQASRWVTAGLN